MEHNPQTDLNEDLRNIEQILLEEIITRRERLAHARELAGYLPKEIADKVKSILRSDNTFEGKAIEIHFLEQSLRADRC